MKKKKYALTQIPGAPDRTDLVEGMAHFEGTGPLGAKCEMCDHHTLPVGRGLACRQYWRLTHTFPKQALSGKRSACRYFVEKARSPNAVSRRPARGITRCRPSSG